MYQLGWFSTGRDKPCNRYWNEIERYTAEKIKKEQGESNRLFQLIRQRGLAREFPLIIATLKAFNQSKIEVSSGKQVIDAEGSPINGYNLTEEIDKVVKQGGVI